MSLLTGQRCDVGRVVWAARTIDGSAVGYSVPKPQHATSRVPFWLWLGREPANDFYYQQPGRAWW